MIASHDQNEFLGAVVKRSPIEISVNDQIIPNMLILHNKLQGRNK